jgi:hypothetical protein
MKAIDPSMPSKVFARLASRQQATLLIQLRSRHIPLMHHIGKVNPPLCLECRKEETVSHYLIECKRFAGPRRKLKARLKREATSIRTLHPTRLRYLAYSSTSAQREGSTRLAQFACCVPEAHYGTPCFFFNLFLLGPCLM